MIQLRTDDPFLITLNLPFGESDRFVRCKIYNKDGVDVTPNPAPILDHIENGLYMNAETTLLMPEGFYVVRAFIYLDSNYATLDPDYGTAQALYLVRNDEAGEAVIDIEQKLADLNETMKVLKQPDLEAEFSVNETP